MQSVIVVAGGDTPPPPGLRAQLPDGALVLAADSGLAHAEVLGLRVARVIGDLDSVDPVALDRAVAAGTRVERHPAAKDATDLELALDAAHACVGPGDRVVVVTSVGGRLDHALANLLVLASPKYTPVVVDAFVDRWHVCVVRPPGRSFATRAGQLVTLVAMHGPAEGVVTHDLLYPLRDETLWPGSSRGVSNVATGAAATVDLHGGVLLSLHQWAD